MPVFQLSDKIVFPPVHLAHPKGLLAIGGDLGVERLVLAYSKGIFPWYTEHDPLLWWSPDPRLVIYPEEFQIPKRLLRTLRQNRFRVTADRDFEAVIRGCAEAYRKDEAGTWIVPDMIEAYCRLHKAGYAHSVEVWKDERLAGGLYGVSLGRAFFGESMFSSARDASKVGFCHLAENLKTKHFTLIDCQIQTDHLMRFGARSIPRAEFVQQLEQSLTSETLTGSWHWFEQMPFQ